jgi:copper chaperone NosL
MKRINTTAILILSLLFASCTRNFEPFEYGKEACSYCKMTIVDQRYASEMIDQKGKIFKFDDIACLKHYIDGSNIQEQGLKVFVSGYIDHKVLDAEKAIYLKDDYFKSPMKGNAAAFSNAAQGAALKDSLNTAILSWTELKF